MSENDAQSTPSNFEPLPEGVKGYRRDGRRIYQRGFRERVAAQAREPGRSLSSVAMHYGINANLVRRWVDQFSPVPTTMLPVSLSTLPGQQSTGAMTAGVRTTAATLNIQVEGVAVTLDGRIDASFVEAVVRALSPR